MKKIVVLALLFIGTRSFAQNFDFGIKAGPNVSNFTGGSTSTIKNDTWWGWHAGAYIGLYIGHNFSIQPEVLLSTQGAKLDDGITKKDYKLTYINIPVMAKYRFNGGFYLEAGPQVGVNINEKYGDNSSDFAKSLPLYISGGLGYASKIGLGIGARYTAGLSNVGNFDINNVHPDYKNNLIQVSIFYSFLNGFKK